MTPKAFVLRALHRAGMFAALRHIRRRSLLVLTYHGVMPGADDRYDFLLANFGASSAFERHLQWIGNHYQFVSLAQVAAALRGGPPLPPGAATVTFDDGFANNYRVAFPILRRHGVPCTIFLTTGKIGVPGAELWTERVKRAIYLSQATTLPPSIPGVPMCRLDGPAARERAARLTLGILKRMPVHDRDEATIRIEAVCGRPAIDAPSRVRYDFLTWDEVRAMAREGVEFGSHTVNHPILTTIPDVSLEYELLESKRTIEAEIQKECYAFAYRNGSAADFGEREKRALERLGYRLGFSLGGSLNTMPSDPFAISRVNISREFDAPLFNATITGAMADLRRLKPRGSRTGGVPATAPAISAGPR